MEFPSKSFQGKEIKDWMIASVVPGWYEQLPRSTSSLTERDFQLWKGKQVVHCTFPILMPYREAKKLLAKVYSDLVNQQKTHQETPGEKAALEELIKVKKDLSKEAFRKLAMEHYNNVMAGEWASIQQQRDILSAEKKRLHHPKIHRKRRAIPKAALIFIKSKNKKFLEEDPQPSLKSRVERTYDKYRDAQEYDQQNWPRVSKNLVRTILQKRK